MIRQATERLQAAFRVCRSHLRTVGDTLDEEVRRVGTEARGERAKLPEVAAHAEAVLADCLRAVQHVRDALGAAAAPEATLTQQLAAAEASVLIRDVERVRVLKRWKQELLTPVGDLRVALAEAGPFLPAFEAAAARRVHACAVLARRLFVDEVTDQFAGLKQEVERVQARRTAPDPVEAACAARGRVAPEPGRPVPWPELEGLTGGDWRKGRASKGAGPGAGPVDRNVVRRPCRRHGGA